MPALVRAPNRPYRSPVLDSSRWDNFRPRRDDIIVATYPKSGTTWMQRIVDLLIFQTPEPRPVTDIAPWLDSTLFGPVEKDLATLEAQTHRRFIKTHLPFDSVPIFDEVRYIHVARDGRDAGLSMHNHQIGFRPEFLQARMANAPKGAARPPETPADPRAYFLDWLAQAENYRNVPGANLPYFEFENTYWSERKRANLLLVHYNDLKKDLEGEMQRLADYLGIAIEAPLLRALASAASFETMKEHGNALMPAVGMVFDRGSDRFLNKGIVGRWKEILKPEDVARYEALVRDRFTPSEARWMEQGRLVAGDPKTLPD